jgi:hypothetical protein
MKLGLTVMDCINRNSLNNRTSREETDTPTDNHDHSNAKQANPCIAIDASDIQSSVSDYDLDNKLRRS